MQRMICHATSFAFALLTACSSDSKGPSENNQNNTSIKVLSATINGGAFNPTLISGQYNRGNLTISGASGNRSLNISATGLSGAGSYSFGDETEHTMLGTFIDGSAGHFSTGYTGGSGTVTLTEARLGRLTGTFTFIAYTAAGTGVGNPVITVTNGVFDITVP